MRRARANTNVDQLALLMLSKDLDGKSHRRARANTNVEQLAIMLSNAQNIEQIAKKEKNIITWIRRDCIRGAVYVPILGYMYMPYTMTS